MHKEKINMDNLFILQYPLLILSIIINLKKQLFIISYSLSVYELK